MKKIVYITYILIFTIIMTPGCAGKTPPNTVFSADDLRGKSIGVVNGSAATVYASGYGTLHAYDSAETMLTDLKNGALDCAVMQENAAKSAIKKVSGLKILSTPLVKADFCFAIAKENPDLTKAANDALKQLEENGTLKNLMQGYVLGKGYSYKSPGNVDLSAGTLTLAVDPNFPPYAYKDAKGQYRGLDIDVAHAVCDILHVKMDIIEADRADLVITVQYGKSDISLGGLTNNETDAKLVDFSNAYTKCTEVIIVRK